MTKIKETTIKLKIFKPSLINKTDYLMWLKDKDVIKYLYRQELFSGIEKYDLYESLLFPQSPTFLTLFFSTFLLIL